MFTLITGAPGSGKTSHLLHKLKDETRPVYYRGIRDLRLPWIELTDEEAYEWYDHLPDGAILVIDEVQDIFPQRPHTRPTPEGCSIISRHRHRGWDLYFITQTPTALDHEARKYVNEHIHYSRSFGAPIVTEYHKGNGLIDLNDRWALKNECNSRQKRLPKDVWELYHSAEVHTHQFRLPSKLLWLPALLIAIGLLAWRAVAWFDGMREQADDFVEQHKPVASQPAMVAGVQRAEVQGSADEWAELLKPAVPGMPYTAPLYRAEAMQVRDVPIVAGCIASESDCTCYTQQGTRIHDMPQAVCRHQIKHGAFNHLRSARKGEAGLPAARVRSSAVDF